MNKLAVIIPAAGSGSRMGTHIPKPFLLLNGIPILEHTIKAFVHLDFVEEIIVATSNNYIDEIQTIFQEFQDSGKKLKVVLGGEERQHSIWNALQELSSKSKLVAVHDAVRPFISKELITKCSEIALEWGGGIIAVPAKDTIKKVNQDRSIHQTPDRSDLWQAQTPQIFQKELLLNAYKSAIEDDFVGTDDASLVERVGGMVKVVEGDRRNLKITYPIDIKVAELILDERSEQ